MAEADGDLTRSLDPFRMIIGAAPVAMLMVDQQGTIMVANEAAEGAFGYQRSQLLGQSVDTLLPPPMRHHHRALRDSFLGEPSGGQPSRRVMGAGRDLQARREDGSVFAIEVGLSPVATADGPFVLAVVADITERRRVAARLDETLSLQADIVAASSDAIVSQTVEGVITSWNPGAERMFGYPAREALGQSLSALIAPAGDCAAERARLSQAGATGQALYFEAPRRRKDGGEIAVGVTLSPIKDQAGRVVGFSTVKRDLSAQRSAEHRFQMVVEAVPTAIVMINPMGIIELVNAQAERIFGGSRQALVGRWIGALLADGLFDATRAGPMSSSDIASLCAGGAGRESAVRRGDGCEIPVAVSLGPIETDAGTMVLAAMADITDRVAARRTLASQRAELQRSNEELLTFAHVASHDLKSPLRGIFQLARWIDQDLQDCQFDAIPGYVKLLHNRIRRMETLLDDLLSYSRVGANQAPPGEVDMAELATAIFDTEMAPSGMRLRLEGDLPRFTTSVSLLSQVLRNLFSNAIKHHDCAAGRIVLASRTQAAGWFEFRVSDDGPGIPVQYHEKVFAMFQTLRQRDQVEGSGMGLALVRKIVERAGGRVWIDPIDGRGCTIRFTWPAAPVADAVR